jgi:hypothetical protein
VPHPRRPHVARQLSEEQEQLARRRRTADEQAKPAGLAPKSVAAAPGLLHGLSGRSGATPLRQAVVAQLQGQLGNAAIQRLVAARRPVGAAPAIQRWPWDDEEDAAPAEEPAAEQSGGESSWLDDLLNPDEEEGGGAGGEWQPEEGEAGPGDEWQQGEEEQPAAEQEEEKSWWDELWDDEEEEDGDGGPSWWDELWDDEEEEDEEGEEEEEEEELPEDVHGTVEPIIGAPLPGIVGCDTPQAGRARLPRSTEGKKAWTRRPVKVNVQFDFLPSQRQAEPESQTPLAADSMVGSFSFGSSIIAGEVFIPAGAFGYAEPRFSVKAITYDSSWIYNEVTVTASVEVEVRWNMSGEGRDAVNSADSPAVTELSWQNVVKDLTPNSGGKPPRQLYWSPSLTKAHELYHASDYIGRAKAYLGPATMWFNSQTIEVPFWDEDAYVHQHVKGLMSNLARQFEDDCMAHYKSGGEDRAYGAGRAGYEGLVAAIRQRATNEKWPGA